MDLKQIKDLMSAMEKAGIKKLALKEKTGFELQLEREGDHPAPVVHSFSGHSHSPVFVPHPMRDLPGHPPMLEESKDAKTPALDKKEGKWISSPMVGTFYSAPSPDDPAFIKVGDKIDENTVVCIIEAMKVMNEVKAGVSGTVAEIFLENGHPVEFGTKLFRIV